MMHFLAVKNSCKKMNEWTEEKNPTPPPLPPKTKSVENDERYHNLFFCSFLFVLPWNTRMSPNLHTTMLSSNSNDIIHFLSRNWGFHWNDGGSSSDPCSDIYMGKYRKYEGKKRRRKEENFVKHNILLDSLLVHRLDIQHDSRM